MNDLEHFILKPGETLILRPRKIMATNELNMLCKHVGKLRFPVVVIPANMDIFAGRIEERESPAAEPITTTAVVAAYVDGKFIQYRGAGTNEQWFDAHRTMAPIVAWDFAAYDYRLKPK